MLGFNGGTIGIANTVFIGTKSDDPNYSSVSLLLNGNETSGSDPNYSNVSLLLNGNGDNGSTTFTDSSSYGHTVTRVGDAQISTAQNKFGGASMYFDGNGDYLTLPNDQTAFDFGTSDFTIESWIYWPGGVGNIFSQRHAYDNNNTGMTWRTITNYLQFFYGNGLGSFVTPSGSLSTNTWNHIALTRNGNTFTMWINGQSQATNTITASMIYYPPVIGRVQGVNGEYFTGHLDDYRITKGIARYISNFQPPTAQLPDFGNTITDSSSYGHTVTANGNAQISTAQSKFGGASMYFDGTGDYINCPASTAFSFGTGDFTIEFFARWDSFSSLSVLVDTRAGGSSSAGLVILTDTNGDLLVYSGVAVFITGGTLQANQWYFVALSRASGTTRLFIDGVQSGASASDTRNYTDQNFFAGRTNESAINYFSGYIDDLRITKGVARYTSNFTPPTAQLPGGETGTFASGLWTSSDHIKQIRNELWPGLIVTDGLVLHLDAGDSASYPGSGTTWFDLTTNSNDGTISGATYGSADGGSLSFDGNDYVSSFSSQIYGTGSKTVTVWFKVATTSRAGLCGTRPNDGTQKGWVLTVNQTQGDLTYFHTGVAGITVSNVISTNVWYCATATYDSSSTLAALYLNGSQLASQSSFDSSNSSNFNGIIGNEANVGGADSRPFVGDIAQVSIYNRVLTQSEVTQNYNALKGRYGL